MERQWLQQFYEECGREVSLAYNTLNQSNTWGVTLSAAVLATGFLGAVDFRSGNITLMYPNTIHWIYVIVAWIIMLRFFIRSALALTNMYRWNTLIYASSKVLSLSEDHPEIAIFRRNCIKKIDAYYYRWKSPISKKKLIRENLKLMYFWFLLIILILFIWGVSALQRDWLFIAGIALFIVPTGIEAFWFMSTSYFEHETQDLEEEPRITELWESEEKKMHTDHSRTVVFGFCKDGPYKKAEILLNNPEVNWLPWSYHKNNIDPTLFEDLEEGISLADRRVIFATWHSDFHGEVSAIRSGRVDHFTFRDGILRVTVFLEPKGEASSKSAIVVNNPDLLCSYLPNE